MKKITLILFAFAVILGVSSCKEKDTPTLGDAPTAADAAFTYAPSAGSANIIDFTASNTSLTSRWDFGNGTIGEGSTAQGTYPNKGTYTVTHTVFNSGGSASSSQDIVIDADDQSLLNNPLFTLLTGGTAGGGEKTWVIDSTRAGHLGVGPVAGTWPEWWAADPGIKANSGLYSDLYTFKLQAFKFDQVTNGSVFVKTGSQSQFPGAYANSDDYTAPFANQLGETWTLTEGADTTITISGKAFLGMYTGVRVYKILKLTENELSVRYVDAADPTTAWYLRLVPKDFPVDGGGGGGGDVPVNTSTLTLPINFETGDTSQWVAFGNSSLDIVNNPNSSGINTSAKVLESIHGDQTWAGFYVNLKDKFDFTTGKKTISIKVWAPVTGDFRIKLENFAKPTEFVERDVAVTVANSWQEISIDFSDVATGLYDRLVMFPGWNVANAGTFYIDDVSQK